MNAMNFVTHQISAKNEQEKIKIKLVCLLSFRTCNDCFNVKQYLTKQHQS